MKAVLENGHQHGACTGERGIAVGEPNEPSAETEKGPLSPEQSR